LAGIVDETVATSSNLLRNGRADAAAGAAAASTATTPMRRARRAVAFCIESLSFRLLVQDAADRRNLPDAGVAICQDAIRQPDLPAEL
jgi:hypothetical protein